MSGPYILRRIDHGGEHRATIKGGNHEPLMAITEGINEQRDVETALLRSLEALLTDTELDQDQVSDLVATWCRTNTPVNRYLNDGVVLWSPTTKSHDITAIGLVGESATVSVFRTRLEAEAFVDEHADDIRTAVTERADQRWTKEVARLLTTSPL